MRRGNERAVPSRFLELAIIVMAIAFAVAMLAGCSSTGTPEPTIVYQEVPVRIPAPCVVDKPEPVVPMNQRVSAEEWTARAPGAKARTVQAQAGDRLNYEGRLEVATSACPEVTPDNPRIGSNGGPGGDAPEDLLPPAPAQ